MKNFLISFTEKEGSSPLVRLLSNFPQVEVVRRVGNAGWEPFDRHNCGQMWLEDLEVCFEAAFGPAPVDMAVLNRIYERTGLGPLQHFSKAGSVGFKMRYQHPQNLAPPPFGWFQRYRDRFAWEREQAFVRFFDRMVLQHHLVVFIAVRQDLFRWALSKYHGDGSGKPGHPQFRLERGDLKREEMRAVHVDPERFEALLRNCMNQMIGKKRLFQRMRSIGADVHVVRYEDMLRDQLGYFRGILGKLGHSLDDAAISDALNAGTTLKKVHSDDISHFVLNHQEITERFGSRYLDWDAFMLAAD